MIKRQCVIQTARGQLDTPYKHQGRLPKVGLDCIGLIIHVCTTLGIPCHDYTGYARIPDGDTLKRELSKDAIERPISAHQPGDILVFAFGVKKQPIHCAFQTNYGMIHTHAKLGKVVEHRLADVWVARIDSVFELVGVEARWPEGIDALDGLTLDGSKPTNNCGCNER